MQPPHHRIMRRRHNRRTKREDPGKGAGNERVHPFLDLAPVSGILRIDLPVQVRVEVVGGCRDSNAELGLFSC